MTKEKFLNLSTEQITQEIISDVYEYSLNTGIDYVDSVDMDKNIIVYYYYDGEPCFEKFSSIEDLKFKVKTYGK